MDGKQLVRAAFRVAYSMPAPLVRRKTIYNIRELFEIYSKTPQSSEAYIFASANAKGIIGTMKKIANADEKLVEALLKPFDSFVSAKKSAKTVAVIEEIEPNEQPPEAANHGHH